MTEVHEDPVTDSGGPLEALRPPALLDYVSSPRQNKTGGPQDWSRGPRGQSRKPRDCPGVPGTGPGDPETETGPRVPGTGSGDPGTGRGEGHWEGRWGGLLGAERDYSLDRALFRYAPGREAVRGEAQKSIV